MGPRPSDRRAELPPCAALSKAVAALERAGIAVALRRDVDADHGSAEIDLRVAPASDRTLERVLASCGFAPLAAWGHRSHRFFLTYEPASDRWLKLDLVVERQSASTREERLRGRGARLLRRLLYTRRFIGPEAPTILVSAPARPGGAADEVVRLLGLPVLRVRSSGGEGLRAALRLRTAVELARRLTGKPLVVDALPGEARLLRTDVRIDVAGTRGRSGATSREINAALWRAYVRRLPAPERLHLPRLWRG